MIDRNVIGNNSGFRRDDNSNNNYRPKFVPPLLNIKGEGKEKVKEICKNLQISRNRVIILEFLEKLSWSRDHELAMSELIEFKKAIDWAYDALNDAVNGGRGMFLQFSPDTVRRIKFNEQQTHSKLTKILNNELYENPENFEEEDIIERGYRIEKWKNDLKWKQARSSSRDEEAIPQDKEVKKLIEEMEEVSSKKEEPVVEEEVEEKETPEEIEEEKKVSEEKPSFGVKISEVIEAKAAKSSRSGLKKKVAAASKSKKK